MARDPWRAARTTPDVTLITMSRRGKRAFTPPKVSGPGSTVPVEPFSPFGKRMPGRADEGSSAIRIRDEARGASTLVRRRCAACPAGGRKAHPTVSRRPDAGAQGPPAGPVRTRSGGSRRVSPSQGVPGERDQPLAVEIVRDEQQHQRHEQQEDGGGDPGSAWAHGGSRSVPASDDARCRPRGPAAAGLEAGRGRRRRHGAPAARIPTIARGPAGDAAPDGAGGVGRPGLSRRSASPAGLGCRGRGWRRGCPAAGRRPGSAAGAAWPWMSRRARRGRGRRTSRS
jgi:hypothetical protein